MYTVEKHRTKMQSTNYLGMHKDKESSDKASGKTWQEVQFPHWEFLPGNPHHQGLLGGLHPPHPAAPWHAPLCLSWADLKTQARKTLALLKEKIEDKDIITA